MPRLYITRTSCHYGTRDNGCITKLSRHKQKSYKLMKMKMFGTFDKANPDTGNIRGLNLEAVKRTTVQVSSLLL
jgi:hypothetical protein